MRWMPAWSACFLFAVAMSAGSTVSAQPSEAPESRDLPDPRVTRMDPPQQLRLQSKLLEKFLERSAQGAKRERRFAGWGGVIGGSIGFGVGVWRMVADNDDDNEFWRGLGAAIMSVGAINLATGIFQMARKHPEELTIERWRRRSKSTLDARSIGHFEGEFRAMANARNRLRRLTRWLSLGQAFAGVGVLALTPVPDLNRVSRRTGYIIGAVYTGVGLLGFGMTFRPTATEKLWDRYRQVVELEASPQFGRGYGGVALSGRF